MCFNTYHRKKIPVLSQTYRNYAITGPFFLFAQKKTLYLLTFCTISLKKQNQNMVNALHVTVISKSLVRTEPQIDTLVCRFICLFPIKILITFHSRWARWTHATKPDQHRVYLPSKKAQIPKRFVSKSTIIHPPSLLSLRLTLQSNHPS